MTHPPSEGGAFSTCFTLALAKFWVLGISGFRIQVRRAQPELESSELGSMRLRVRGRKVDRPEAKVAPEQQGSALTRELTQEGLPKSKLTRAARYLKPARRDRRDLLVTRPKVTPSRPKCLQNEKGAPAALNPVSLSWRGPGSATRWLTWEQPVLRRPARGMLWCDPYPAECFTVDFTGHCPW